MHGGYACFMSNGCQRGAAASFRLKPSGHSEGSGFRLFGRCWAVLWSQRSDPLTPPALGASGIGGGGERGCSFSRLTLLVKSTSSFTPAQLFHSSCSRHPLFMQSEEKKRRIWNFTFDYAVVAQQFGAILLQRRQRCRRRQRLMLTGSLKASLVSPGCSPNVCRENWARIDRTRDDDLFNQANAGTTHFHKRR